MFPNLLSSVNSIHNNVETLGIKIISGISDFNKVVGSMIEETIHTSLKLIKDSFISIQKEMNGLIADLIEEKVKIKII